MTTSIFTPGYISGKNENTNYNICVHPNIHSTTYNNQDMKATQMAINR